MADENKFRDAHTVYLFSGYLFSEQVSQELNRCIQCLVDDKIIAPEVHRDFEVMCVRNQQNVPKLHSFVFFVSPVLKNIFLGLNPDGSERVVYKPVPVSLPKSQGVAESWADLVDEELPQTNSSNQVVETVLGSLISFEPIQYTQEQQELWDDLDGSDFGNGETYTLSGVKHCELNDLRITRPEKHHNVISSKNSLPQWVDEEFIMPFFAIFSHDKTKHSESNRGKITTFTYPKIYISRKEMFDRKDGVTKPKNTLIVTYNPQSPDAQFAMCFRRFFTIVNPKTKEEFVVAMDHQTKNENRFNGSGQGGRGGYQQSRGRGGYSGNQNNGRWRPS